MGSPKTEFFLTRIKKQYCKKNTNMSVSFSSFGPRLNWQKTQEITTIPGFSPKIKRLFPKTQVFGKVLAFSTCSTQKLTSIDQNSMIFCWNSMMFYRNSSFFFQNSIFRQIHLTYLRLPMLKKKIWICMMWTNLIHDNCKIEH